MRPRGLKLLPFAEGDCIVLVGGQRTLKRACLLAQRLQFLGPALGPCSMIGHAIVCIDETHCTEGDCGKDSDCSYHRDPLPQRLSLNTQKVDDEQTNAARRWCEYSGSSVRCPTPWHAIQYLIPPSRDASMPACRQFLADVAVNRREFLRAGSLGLFGLGLPQ